MTQSKFGSFMTSSSGELSFDGIGLLTEEMVPLIKTKKFYGEGSTVYQDLLFKSRNRKYSVFGGLVAACQLNLG